MLFIYSEVLYREMADALADGGFKQAGYEFINMDDCWMSKARDAQGRLQPDPLRFPNGLKALADYVRLCIQHSTVTLCSSSCRF